MSDQDDIRSVGAKRSSMSTSERMAYIESDVHYIKKDIAAIKSWVKWIAMTVLGVALVAITRFILSGGFNIPPPGGSGGIGP
jgi:hypothetical protein